MTLTARLLYPIASVQLKSALRGNFENMLQVMQFDKSWYAK